MTRHNVILFVATLLIATAAVAATPTADIAPAAEPAAPTLDALLAPAAGSCDQPVEAMVEGAAKVEAALFPIPIEIPCNQATCNAKTEFCCNRSCSICAPRGGACTQQFCPPIK